MWLGATPQRRIGSGLGPRRRCLNSWRSSRRSSRRSATSSMDTSVHDSATPCGTCARRKSSGGDKTTRVAILDAERRGVDGADRVGGTRLRRFCRPSWRCRRALDRVSSGNFKTRHAIAHKSRVDSKRSARPFRSRRSPCAEISARPRAGFLKEATSRANPSMAWTPPGTTSMTKFSTRRVACLCSHASTAFRLCFRSDLIARSHLFRS